MEKFTQIKLPNAEYFSINDYQQTFQDSGNEHSFLYNGFILGICLQGTIRIKINYSEYDLSSPQLFVIFPRHLFSVLSHSSDLKLKIFHLSPDFILSLPIAPDLSFFQKTAIQPYTTIDQNTIDDLKTLCHFIDRYEPPIKNTLMQSLVLLTASKFEQANLKCDRLFSRQEILTQHFFDLLSQFFLEKRKVSFYADRLFVTPKYLSTTVKTVTGFPIQNWINEIITTEAKRYMKTTDYTIQQIAEQLNFPTATSFSRFFKRYTGYKPLEYRKLQTMIFPSEPEQ